MVWFCVYGLKKILEWRKNEKHVIGGEREFVFTVVASALPNIHFLILAKYEGAFDHNCYFIYILFKRTHSVVYK